MNQQTKAAELLRIVGAEDFFDPVRAHLRRANETLRTLPSWVKLTIAVQCLLPGVALWYRMKYLAYKGIELRQMVEMIQKMKTLPESQYHELLKIFSGALHAGNPGTSSTTSSSWPMPTRCCAPIRALPAGYAPKSRKA